MRIFIALTYYRPHHSGLTIYVERLAKALVQRSHQVTILTSRYLPELPLREVRDGVEVIRPKVWFRLSKGVIMPSMPVWAWRLMRQADIVNLHVPQMDAIYMSLLARLMGKPSVLTYHCDLILPKGLIHQLANTLTNWGNHITASTSDRIVTNTLDFARESPFLKKYLQKIHIIPTPVELVQVSDVDLLAFRAKHNILPGQRIIGMAARLATEKGVEYLIEAMPAILKKYPNARVLFVGQYQDVLGEELYAQRLAPLIQQLGDHWKFLGVVSPVELTAFFKTCDLTVLPSINSTESFGIVQVESMSCGTPVVASDMPGVRQPVRESGMGLIVPPRDAGALAEAIIQLLDSRNGYQDRALAMAQHYAPASVAQEYERLFQEVAAKYASR